MRPFRLRGRVAGAALLAVLAALGFPGVSRVLPAAAAAAPLQNWNFAVNYERSAPLQLAGTSMCAAVPNDSTAAGAGLETLPCTGGNDQKWSYSWEGNDYNDSPRFRLQNPATGTCPDDPQSATGAGTPALQEPCTYNNDQLWEFYQVGAGKYELYNVAGGLCLSAATSASGTALTQRTCAVPPGPWKPPTLGSGTAHHAGWFAPMDGSPYLQGGSFALGYYPNMCAQDPGGSAAGGAVQDLGACNGGADQVYVLLWTGKSAKGGPQFEVQNLASGNCLDTHGALTPGSTVQLWPCTGAASQIWHLYRILTGSTQYLDGFEVISTQSGRCASAIGSTAGTQLTQHDCYLIPAK